MSDKKPTLEELDKNLMSHEYDGIRELDNNLPPWWIALFILSIAWGLTYLWYYHIIDTGWSQISAYEEELREAQLARVHYMEEQARMEKLAALNQSAASATSRGEVIAAGKKVWAVNCNACHMDDGGGGIGPNMTDKYWLHGNSKEAIKTVIRNGVIEKGMQSWKTLLSSKQIDEVTEFILSLQGTTPQNPKEPQGELYEP